jgi:hypothetical protein
LIGVYPPTLTTYPIGAVLVKNLTLTMGNWLALEPAGAQV